MCFGDKCGVYGCWWALGVPLGAFKDCFKLYIQRLFLSASKIGGREKVRKRAKFASNFCQQTMPANDASKLENVKYET